MGFQKEYTPWNKGKTAWNKGLTKETDERVKKYGKSGVGKHSGKHKKHVFSEESKRSLIQSKIGDNNPSKRIDVRERIRKKVIENYNNPELRLKERISDSCKKAHQRQEVRDKFLRFNKIPPSRKGKKLSGKLKRRISQIMTKQWQNPEYKEKQIASILKGLLKRPTSYEKKIMILIDKHNLPFRYVGDGNIIINFCNPDFISTTEDKLIIEVFYSFYKKSNYVEERNKKFVKLGYSTLFLDEKDVDCSDWEKRCLDKIQKLIQGENVDKRNKKVQDV